MTGHLKPVYYITLDGIASYCIVFGKILAGILRRWCRGQLKQLRLYCTSLDLVANHFTFGGGGGG